MIKSIPPRKSTPLTNLWAKKLENKYERNKKYYDTVNETAISLPTHIERNGYMVPLISSDGIIRDDLDNVGIMPMIEAVPETGKTITASHGEVIDGQYIEVIDEQLSDEEIEAARIAALPAEAQELRSVLTSYGVDPNSSMAELLEVYEVMELSPEDKATLKEYVTQLWLACVTQGIKLGDL